MLIVVIILIALAIILGNCLEYQNHEDMAALSYVGAFVLGVVSFFIVISVIYSFQTGIVADDKIKMYQEENKNIERDIDVLIKQYMSYESETYKNFKSESSITLVNLFPDLKSSELVKKQLEIYLDNNKKIKELKEDLIEFKIAKWLLYFEN